MRDTFRHIVQTPFVLLLDVIFVNVGLFLSLLLPWGGFVSAEPSLKACLHVAPFVTVAALTLLYVSDLYGHWFRRTATEVAYSVTSSICILALVTMALSFWQQQFALPRHVALVSAALQTVFLAGFRLTIRRLHMLVFGKRRVLVVAETGETARTIVEKLLRADNNWFSVTGWLLSDEMEELESRAADFDGVLVMPGVLKKAELARRCGRIGKEVMIIPEVFELSLVGAKAMEIGDVLMFSMRPPSLTPGQRLVKRAIDFVGSLLMIVATGPLLLILPILIRLSSKGPALFRQDRVGRDGVEYTLFKFRTMISNAESSTGPVLASQNDPRITRIGRFLRSTRLDELPQLFNVLSGEMSLVGPRPEREFFVSQFRQTTPGYEFRLAVKPGITGMAQVCGTYSSSVSRKLRFDLMYIYDYSLLMDVKILLKTVHVLFEKAKSDGVHTEAPSAPQVTEEVVAGD